MARPQALQVLRPQGPEPWVAAAPLAACPEPVVGADQHFPELAEPLAYRAAESQVAALLRVATFRAA